MLCNKKLFLILKLNLYINGNFKLTTKLFQYNYIFLQQSINPHYFIVNIILDVDFPTDIVTIRAKSIALYIEFYNFTYMLCITYML